jgi:hypothetical protein
MIPAMQGANLVEKMRQADGYKRAHSVLFIAHARARTTLKSNHIGGLQPNGRHRLYNVHLTKLWHLWRLCSYDDKWKINYKQCKMQEDVVVANFKALSQQ